jgi:tetratricopeptide (TPR) repeat protein
MAKKRKRIRISSGGMTPEAVARREKIIGLNPWGGYNHNSLGCEFGEMGSWALAASEFEMAIEINPWEPMFKANLARAFVALGRYEDAEAMAKAALARKPRLPLAFHALGLVSEVRGHYAKAAGWYRRCLDSGASVVIRREVQECLELVLERLKEQGKAG